MGRLQNPLVAILGALVIVAGAATTALIPVAAQATAPATAPAATATTTPSATPAPPYTKPKVRAITAFVRLDRSTYTQQIGDALTVLRAAKSEFEKQGYQVETVRIVTQPLAEGYHYQYPIT